MTGQGQQIGRHQLRIEGEVFLLRWLGPCSLAELNEVLGRIERLLPTLQQPFLLIDSVHAVPGTPEVRQRLYQWSRSHRLAGGVAIFGAALATRAIGILIVNAIALFKRGDARKRMVFVRDEAEARAWIASQRASSAQLELFQ